MYTSIFNRLITIFILLTAEKLCVFLCGQFPTMKIFPETYSAH